jgi:gamma-glutamyl-gamma-aminobutyrate hydrolase PuuD
MNGACVAHARASHRVCVCDSQAEEMLKCREMTVNSFHHQGIRESQLSPALRLMARSDDDIVEALYHPHLPIAGVQWHPERGGDAKDKNAKLIQAYLRRTHYWRECNR